MNSFSSIVSSNFVRIVIKPFCASAREMNRFVAYVSASRYRLTSFAVVGLGVWYLSVFVLPQSVNFAYAGQTCVPRIVLLPSLQTHSGSKNFSVSYDDTFGVGSWRFLATEVCFEPVNAPNSNTSDRIATSLFGLPLFTDVFRVQVPNAPLVAQSTEVASVAVTKPLVLSLTSHDDIFSYVAAVDDKTQRCVVSRAELACRLDKLELSQGEEYEVEVQRSFADEPIDTVALTTVKILPATKIVNSSIKNGAIVYSKPKQLVLESDKSITGAIASLTYDIDGAPTAIDTTTQIVGQKIIVSWQDDLPREHAYRLILSRLEAVDGSTLATPYTLNFATSGGPKVVSVDIGPNSVASGAVATVTFDQALIDTQNVLSFARITGGKASVYKSGERQISFRLSAMAPCTSFTLHIAQGLIGTNELTGTTSWTYSSRTSCRVVTETIGYSVLGRALTAYYYGTGSKTILFTGGIHGSEPSGVYLLQDLIAYLDATGYKIPADTRVVVVPNVNPDGIAVGQRYNANGVNLARNFPSADWSPDIDTAQGILQNAGGTEPLSEPEARALAALTRKLNPRLMVSYHARGSLVGINDVRDSRALGTVYANMVSYGTMFDNAEAIMGYSFTGEYETWMGEELGAPAVLIELPGYYGRYFWSHADALWRMVEV